MTVAIDCIQRSAAHAMVPLEDRFEVIKEIGDGSFGSVALARVRGAGASVARRGTLVSPNVLLDLWDGMLIFG
jgi:meiosis induction protein kinase IME2/SME1